MSDSFGASAQVAFAKIGYTSAGVLLSIEALGRGDEWHIDLRKDFLHNR
jgi:hypothetical protein